MKTRTFGALALISSGAPALISSGAIALGAVTPTVAAPVRSFDHVASYPVSGEVAEILAATPDGRTLVYTDSGAEELGFVDVSDPSAPVELDTLAMPGEPTSVAVTRDGRWALAAVADGSLVVVDLADLAATSVEDTLPLGGQPDSIALSADGEHAAIAIENERDEDVDEGTMPQAPPGSLAIVDLEDPADPSTWSVRTVGLTGIAARFPGDPETEFVDVNARGIAAVTLQENNHVVLVRLSNGAVVGDFAAGRVTHRADLTDDGVASFTEVLRRSRREPDAIAWFEGRLFTANEGDYDLDTEFVGGRGWSIFTKAGEVAFDVKAGMERRIAEAGRYDDGRSDNRGVEAEGLEIGRFGERGFAFVGAERADSVVVYRLTGAGPVFVQVLATGDEPEGLLAIPGRGLFVSANEGDGTIDVFEASPAAQ